MSRFKPLWLWEREAMRVHDLAKTLPAFVGFENGRGTFIPMGTGLMCLWSALGLSVPYLVTALHVIEDIKGESVLVRVADQEGGFQTIELPKTDFVRHPEHDASRNYIDVAASIIPNVLPYDPIAWLRESDFITPEAVAGHNLGIGDEVVVAGMLSKHLGETRNIPIIRVGNIAAMPEEPVPTDKGLMEAYLVEVRSIDGLSGSPVLLHTGVRPPVPKTTDAKIKRYYFIGLVHGHYVIKNPTDAVIGDAEFRTTLPYGDMNTGIAIVVPSERITELLNGRDEAARRTALVKAQLPKTSD
jgi:hypothetical protein